MEVLTTALLGVPVLDVIGDVDHLSALVLDAAVQDALGAHGLRLPLSICANVPILIVVGLRVAQPLPLAGVHGGTRPEAGLERGASPRRGVLRD